MTCQELVGLVTEYLEGALPRDHAQSIEVHLEACGPCRRYLDQMQLTIRATGKLDPESLPPGAMEELLEALDGWVR